MKECAQVISSRPTLKPEISESKFFSKQTFVECPYYFLSLPLNTRDRELKRAWFTPWEANIHMLSCLKKANYYKAIRHLIWNIIFLDLWNCSEFPAHKKRRQRSWALSFCLRRQAAHLMVTSWTFLPLSKTIRWEKIHKRKLQFLQNT